MKSSLKLMAAAAAITMFGIAGCGEESAPNLLASGRTFYKAGDFKSASVQLRAALQKAPNSAEARYLLGSTLLAMDSYTDAEIELRKAMVAGHTMDEVAPGLARALLGMGQPGKAIEEFGAVQLTRPTAQADLSTTLSRAYGALGKFQLAQEKLDAALKADPAFAPAALLEIRRRAASGSEIGNSLELIDKLLAKEPDNIEALKLKGDLLRFGRNDTEGALAAYRAAIKARPSFLRGHWSLAQLLMDLRRLDEAKAAVAAMPAGAQKLPQSQYLLAKMAYLKQDFSGAREQVAQLLKLAPDDVKVLQLAGALEIQFLSMRQAEQYLSKALQLDTGLPVARRMLALIHLNAGQTAKALSTIMPATQDSKADSETLSVAGRAQLQAGDVKAAERLFRRAVEADPKDPAKRTTLAMARLATDDDKGAFKELEDVASSDSGTVADLALISTLLKRGDKARALEAIARLEKKQPQAALPLLLRARVQLASGDKAGGQASLERAATLEPANFEPVGELARLDAATGKPPEARKRLEAFAKAQPDNAAVHLALASIGGATAMPASEIEAHLMKAVSLQPTNATAHLRLTEFYLAQNNAKRALEAAQSGVTTMPESVELIDALGMTLARTGDLNQAISTYGKLANEHPGSPLGHLRLADLYQRKGDLLGAERSLIRAVAVSPDATEVRVKLALLYVSAGKMNEAIDAARKLQSQLPKDPVGHLLEGDILVQQKAWERAIAAYRAGLQRRATSETAAKLYQTLLAAGRGAEAERHLAQWGKDHPKDALVFARLGDFAMAAGDFGAAERHFAAALKIDPKYAAGYNNLAWAQSRLHKPEAIASAQRALELVPDSPEFIDTMASALSDRGEHQKALEMQKRAIAMRPDEPFYQLNLAKILLKAGDTAGARAKLEELEKLGQGFVGRSEVVVLLRQVKAK